MTQLTALRFPDTLVTTASVSQELFIFDRIDFYQSTESESDDNLDPPADSKLCAGYPPAPLGDDLERFRMLLSELKGHEGEFYSGVLSSLTLDYLGNRDGEKTWELISSLQRQGKTGKDKKARNREEILWQARLLLKLAEIIQREEEAMETSMASVADRQRDLFRQLKDGDINDLDEPLAVKPATVSRPSGRTGPLLKAWGQLFLADRQPYGILTTNNAEAALTILDVEESLAGQAPKRAAKLILPSPLVMDGFSGKREGFRSGVAGVLNDFAGLFGELSEKGLDEETGRKLDHAAEQWNRQMEESGLAAEQAGFFLEIYFCQNSPARLLAHLCKATDISLPVSGPKHGLIALTTSAL
ncbi:MAG: hypothetical protein U9R66_12050 [Thermodesulfobacteriota bacterium]|nr:hypothetical protein [Thermodesulfobacteriota bacterium]